MTRGLKAGLLLAVVHTAIVGGVAAKYAVDRETLPRVWVRTVSIDPNAPIRGRYVRLWLAPETRETAQGCYVLQAAGGRLLAGKGAGPGGNCVFLQYRGGPGTRLPAGRGSQPADSAQATLVLSSPLAYFIPDDVPDPTRRKPGEELWVEVSVPPRGSPRPLRLGVMKDGKLTSF